MGHSERRPTAEVIEVKIEKVRNAHEKIIEAIRQAEDERKCDESPEVNPNFRAVRH
jgi:hypothetical protein